MTVFDENFFELFYPINLYEKFVRDRFFVSFLQRYKLLSFAVLSPILHAVSPPNNKQDTFATLMLV